MVKLPVSKGGICVVGDEYFTLGFALGGVNYKYVINVNAPEDEIFKSLSSLVNDLSKKEDIVLVVMQDRLKSYFEKVKQSLNKVVVYVPDITSASKAEVKEYYSSLIRRYLGIALELG